MLMYFAYISKFHVAVIESAFICPCLFQVTI